jgi:hypothetical protein
MEREFGESLMSNKFYTKNKEDFKKNDFMSHAATLIERGYPVATTNVRELAEILEKKHLERQEN